MQFEKLIKTNIVDPYNRIQKNVSGAVLTSKPQTLFAEVVKEGALLPLRNLTQIMNWTGKSMMKALGASLKTGLAAASLIPLPLPGAKRSVAEIKRSAGDIREAFRAKVQGDPRSFKELAQKLKDLRLSTAKDAMHSTAL